MSTSQVAHEQGIPDINFRYGVPMADEEYNAALATIYDIASSETEAGLGERILRPIYEESARQYVGEGSASQARINRDHYHDAVAETAADGLRRLQRDGELDAADQIEVCEEEPDWHFVKYTNTAGEDFVIDPSSGYVGSFDKSPVHYYQVAVQRDPVLKGAVNFNMDTNGVEKTPRIDIKKVIVPGNAAGYNRTYVANDEYGTFAVIGEAHDGGGVGIPKEVRKTALNDVRSLKIDQTGSATPVFDTLTKMAKIMHKAAAQNQAYVDLHPEAAEQDTSAAITQVVFENGKQYLVWAVSGDKELHKVRSRPYTTLSRLSGPNTRHELTDGFVSKDGSSIGVEEIDGRTRFVIASKDVIPPAGPVGDPIRYALTGGTFQELSVRMSRNFADTEHPNEHVSTAEPLLVFEVQTFDSLPKLRKLGAGALRVIRRRP